jgi:hypothetical protein
VGGGGGGRCKIAYCSEEAAKLSQIVEIGSVFTFYGFALQMNFFSC